MSYIIGIDLGGTKIATILSDMQGNIIKRVEEATNAHEGQDAVIERIKETVYKVLDPTKDIVGIGIGSPGPLDLENGVVLKTPNLKWDNVPIRDILEEEFGITTYLENDANAAAAGEYRFGAGKGAWNIIYITVSTGIGSGIIIGGKVYRGAHGIAGELGHTIIDPNGPICGCGQHGCLEAFASGTGLARRAIAELQLGVESIIPELVEGDLQKVTARTLEEAALKGDEFARNMWESTGDYLGIGMTNVINFLDPEMIIIGGGVSKAGELLFEPMRRSIKKRAIESAASKVKIVPAALGKDVGTLGAISVVIEALEAK